MIFDIGQIGLYFALHNAEDALLKSKRLEAIKNAVFYHFNVFITDQGI
jgi:hypothetical protein